jgi:hypothetical protein
MSPGGGEAPGSPGTGLELPEPDCGPPPLPSGFPRWKHFGWDGWHLEIPVDWDLGALESTQRGGFFRIDDEFEPRLMVRWQPVSGTFDPEKAIERHFRKRLKDVPEAAGSRPRIGAPLPGLRKTFRDLAYRTYVLEVGEGRSVGLAAHCPRCRRAFIVEMHLAEKGGAGERLIKRVLGTFGDHATEGLARWEVFGFSLDLPADLRAIKHTFNQGYVAFTAAAPSQRLELARWTLAEAHLRGSDLRNFLAAHLARRRDLPPVTVQDAHVQSHPACTFHTRRKLLEPARSVLRNALRLAAPAHRSGLIWHCQDSNRIIMLTLGSNKPADLASARLFASRVRCCRVVY